MRCRSRSPSSRSPCRRRACRWSRSRRASGSRPGTWWSSRSASRSNVVSALAVAFWGPFEMIGSADLAGGVELELSGAPLAVWRFGHYALLLATSAFAVPLFLGGGAGVWLPPEAWSAIKVLTVSGLLVAAGHLLVRRRLDSFMKRAWIALIPLSLAQPVFGRPAAAGRARPVSARQAADDRRMDRLRAAGAAGRGRRVAGVSASTAWSGRPMR